MSWVRKKISSFTNVTTGGTPSTIISEYWENGTIPWLNSGDLNKGIILEASNFITEIGLNNSSTKLMPADTVLVALTGSTTGVSALLKISACANQSVTGIHPSESHYSKFLYYYFQTQRKNILGKAWGGAQPHINQQFIKDFVVPLPPLIDQIRIASLLDKVESLIVQRQQSILLLDKFLKSSFTKMFGDPIGNEKKWKKIRLGDLVEHFNYGTNKISGVENSDNGFPILRIPNIVEERISYQDLKYSKIDEREKEKIRLIKGDILFVRTNGNPSYIAKCAVFNGDFDCGFASYLIRARLKKDASVSPSFIRNILNFPTYRQLLLSKSTTTAGNYNINIGALKSLMIYLPPIDLQNKFLMISNYVNKIKDRYVENLDLLKSLFSSISQKAFNDDLDLSQLSAIVDEKQLFSADALTEQQQFKTYPQKPTETKASQKTPIKDKKLRSVWKLNLNTRSVKTRITFNTNEGIAIMENLFSKKRSGFTFLDFLNFLKDENFIYQYKDVRDFFFTQLRNEKLNQYYANEEWMKSEFKKVNQDQDDFSGDGSIWFIYNN